MGSGMNTEAVFENIAERIKVELISATESIHIAVAWFTNRIIFELLVEKAKQGCRVSLIVSNDKINQSSTIDFDNLRINKSEVYLVGDGQSELMHNKFCVIDSSVVITGSYNWSYKAENNFENIIVTNDDCALAQHFISKFHSIRRRHYPDESSKILEIPLDIVVKRLEILRNLIGLADIEMLEGEIRKIKSYESQIEIGAIIRLLESKQYGEAVKRIEAFIADSQRIVMWINPEIETLKLEIRSLENQLVAFDNEKREMEKRVFDFHRRHSLELGEIILRILKIKKIKFKSDEAKFEEAEQDEREYRSDYEKEKTKIVHTLTNQEEKELTKKYRKAAFLCHPDLFSNEPIEVQRQAEALMKELAEAKEKKDFGAIETILSNLQKGILNFEVSGKMTDLDLLWSTAQRLRVKIQSIENEIKAIRENETYLIILKIDNFDVYFNRMKNRLNDELKELESEMEAKGISIE
jgi:hypothetical protein